MDHDLTKWQRIATKIVTEDESVMRIRSGTLSNMSVPDVEQIAHAIFGIAESAEAQGRFLCEQCYDVLTDRVLHVDESDSGLEEACCDACYRAREVRKG